MTEDLNEDMMRHELSNPVESMTVMFNVFIFANSERMLLTECQRIADAHGLEATLVHADDMSVDIEFMRAKYAGTGDDMDFMKSAEDVFDRLADYTPCIERMDA